MPARWKDIKVNGITKRVLERSLGDDTCRPSNPDEALLTNFVIDMVLTLLYVFGEQFVMYQR